MNGGLVMSVGPVGSHAAIARYGEYQRRRGFSLYTIRNRRFRLNDFALWLQRQPSPCTILVASSSSCADYLAQCHVAASTSNTYASSLSAFYVWAIKAELTDANPMARVDRMKHPKYKPRPTDDDDLSLALAYAQQTDPRMYAWLLLAHYAGARCIEISRLQVTDINRHAMSLRLFGKGNKERVVPLHPQLLEALTAYGLPSSGHVFRKQTANTTTDSCLTPSTVSRYVGRFMHELGSTATAHQGRHWFGTMVHRESGGDLLVVRDLMGHESTATSEVYTAVDVTKAAPVVGRLSA